MFFFKQNFGYFWQLLEFFRDFLIFKVFKNEIFIIMFYFSFLSLRYYTYVIGHNHSKYYIVMF